MRGGSLVFAWLLAIIMGAISGFIIYMGATMLFIPDGHPGGLFFFITLVGGWILTAIFMVRGSRSIPHTISKGFLIGVLEWFAMIFISVLFSGAAVVKTVAEAPVANSDAATAGAVVGGGIFAAIGIGFSLVRCLICLLGFVIFHLLAREARQQHPSFLVT